MSVTKEFFNGVKISGGSLTTTTSAQIYICQVNSSSQSHATGSNIAVNFGTDLGTVSTHSDKPTYSSGTFTINSTGLYLLTYALLFDNSDTDGWRGTYIQVGGTDNYAFDWKLANTLEDTGHCGTAVFPLTDTTTFEITAYQDSGSAINILGSSALNRASMSCVKLF